jgi:hypothetical protein
MKKNVSLLVLLFFACRHNGDRSCPYTREQFLRENGTKIFATKEAKGMLMEFRDKGKDSVTAGYYSFYDNGSLQSYEYFSTMEVYVYSEQYDRKGNLIKVVGIPLVREFIKLDSDSLVIKLYFFTLHKVYKNIHVIADDNREFDLSLSNDSLYSNMKTASFTYHNLRKKQDIVSYVNVEYEDLCSKEAKSFKDTVSLTYTPSGSP